MSKKDEAALFSTRARLMQIFRIAVVVLGSCVGAGFLSGQELWQFFGVHGKMEFASLLLSMLCFFGIATVVLCLARDSGEHRMDRIVVWFDCRPLRGAVAVFEVIFLFIVYLLSGAAMGSLIAQVLGCHPVWGSLGFCLLCTVFSLYGVRGMVKAFSWIIPLLVVSTVVICIVAVAGAECLSFPEARAEGLVSGNWILDGITYAVFAAFCAIPVLAPLGQTVTRGKSARRGVLFGTVLLGTLALLILLAIATAPAVSASALPMLELAMTKSTVVGYFYAILLMTGIFSAGLSAQSAFNEYFMQRFSSKRRVLLPVTVLMSLLALLLGLFGFRDLVGTLFPLLGYVGVLPLSLILVHAFVFYRKKRREKKEKEE